MVVIPNLYCRNKKQEYSFVTVDHRYWHLVAYTQTKEVEFYILTYFDCFCSFLPFFFF